MNYNKLQSFVRCWRVNQSNIVKKIIRLYCIIQIIILFILVVSVDRITLDMIN